MTQSIFPNNAAFREISRNCSYLAVFRTTRDLAQIGTLSRQMSPRKSKYITDIYEEVTRKPYSYVLFNYHNETEKCLKIMTDLLPHEFPPKIYAEQKVIDELEQEFLQ